MKQLTKSVREGLLMSTGSYRPLKKWQFVAHWLEIQICNGAWASDQKLPSIRSLADKFGVSVTTAQSAILDLEHRGKVRSIPRKGYFIVDPCKSETQIDFDGIDVSVDAEVVQMLHLAATSRSLTMSSAVLGHSLIPNTLLARSAAAVIKKHGSIAHYSAPPGEVELRELIAGKMLKRGVICSAEDIIITSGDTVALEIALRAAGKPGDKVIVEERTYFGILQAIEHAGMRAVPVTTCPKRGIDVEKVGEALRRGPCAAIFLNPTLHNPLGFVMPKDQRMKLTTLAREFNTTIIEDDVFFDLLNNDERVPSIKSFALENTIYCSSFSKTVSPGFRLGWCIPGRHRDTMLSQFLGRNLSAATLSQLVIAEFIKRGYENSHLEQLRQTIAHNNQKLEAVIRASFPDKVIYNRPTSGYVHWLGWPAIGGINELASKLREYGILVSPSTIFSPTSLTTEGIRLCVTEANPREILAGVEKIGLVVSQYLEANS